MLMERLNSKEHLYIELELGTRQVVAQNSGGNMSLPKLEEAISIALL